MGVVIVAAGSCHCGSGTDSRRRGSSSDGSGGSGCSGGSGSSGGSGG